MSAARFNEHLKPLAPGDRVSQAITAARFNAMAKLAQEGAMGVHVRGGPGVRVRSGPQGTTISLAGRPRRMSSVAVHPFYIYDGGKLHAGTINGEIPLLDADPIGEAGNSLSMTGDFFVYAAAEFDLVFGTHYFLTSATLASCEIVTNSTPLSDVLNLAGSTLTTRRLLAQVIGGAVMRDQPTSTNLNVSVCDAGDGTEEGRDARATWNPAGA